MVSVILEWNKLDIDMSNSTSLLQFVRPSPKSLFNCHSPKGIKYEIRSRLGLIYLREHKFKHSFQDNLNSFCDFGGEIETTAHFPLHCPQFYTKHPFNKIKSIDTSKLNQNNSNFTNKSTQFFQFFQFSV